MISNGNFNTFIDEELIYLYHILQTASKNSLKFP